MKYVMGIVQFYLRYNDIYLDTLECIKSDYIQSKTTYKYIKASKDFKNNVFKNIKIHYL